MCGVSLRTVQNWEKGRPISESTLKLISSLIDDECETISQIASNGTNVSGNQNQVNASSTLDKAIDEISEMRKLLAEAIRNNKEQADKFFTIIERVSK